jgi:ABC-type branched-subunit amino acid transport system substrate-binding protein
VSRRRAIVASAAVATTIAIVGGVLVAGVAAPRIRVGAVFPLSGNAAGLAGEELRGVQLAADLVNADGGVGGRRIELDVRDLASGDQAPEVMASLRADGVTTVIGAYSSDLSIPASAAASAAGLVYWEAGAVADRLTGRGLPLVFRVGASGTNLGTNSASFAVEQLAPRLGRTSAGLRVAIVNAQDDYATSVADAAARTVSAAGAPIVARLSYNLVVPGFADLMTALAAARPDVLILASHIPDGVAFRQAMLAAGVHVGAFIGSTMAECDPDFAAALGPDAVGVFASDRPVGGFRPDALDPTARAVYDRFAAAWARATSAAQVQTNAGGDAALSWGTGAWPGGGTTTTVAGGYPGTSSPGTTASTTGATITGPPPTLPWNAPTEEGISGFTAAWALFHDVLPHATGGAAEAIAAAARAVDLPEGSLPNGAGLRFSTDPATLGQNLRAAAVIWQWQAVRSYTYVWPPTYATGSIADVPLTR